MGIPSLTRRSVRGFTLLELMIVLALMVGLLAIAWPNMQKSMNRTTLQEAAQVLREAIDEGRHEAIATGKPIFIQMQNDHHELRSGAFESFESETSEMAPDSSQSSVPTQDSATANMSSEKLPRTWRLPETVVITEVNWTNGSTSTRIDEGNLDSESHSNSSRSVSSNETPSSDVSHPSASNLSSGNSDAIANELDTMHGDWWLPISATGHGRSASIVLYDTAIHEFLTITYAAETGALEIVR